MKNGIMDNGPILTESAENCTLDFGFLLQFPGFCNDTLFQAARHTIQPPGKGHFALIDKYLHRFGILKNIYRIQPGDLPSDRTTVTIQKIQCLPLPLNVRTVLPQQMTYLRYRKIIYPISNQRYLSGN